MTLHAYRNQIYADLVRQYNADNLFKDPEFPTNKSSLYYTPGFNRTLDNVTWKRPYASVEIHFKVSYRSFDY